VGFSTSYSCTTTGYTVGGSISGLGAGLSVALRNATTGENLTTTVVTELPAATSACRDWPAVAATRCCSGPRPTAPAVHG
jgi:hypothetical protein